MRLLTYFKCDISTADILENMHLSTYLGYLLTAFVDTL